jgi:hypothetical protein
MRAGNRRNRGPINRSDDLEETTDKQQKGSATEPHA